VWIFGSLVNIAYICNMKICATCKIEKEITEFHKNCDTKDGYVNKCKTCVQEYDVVYRQSDKVQNYQKSQKYRDRKAEYRKVRFNTTNELQLLIAAKSRAKKYNLPFNIDLSDIVIPEYCPILEIKIERKEYGKGGSFVPSSPSLDKIIPSKGYVKGNVMVISMKANIMKCNASITEILKFSENMIKLIKEEGYGSS